MPTDHARREVEVAAGAERVLATLRDVASQPQWVPAIREAEVLEVDELGLPRTARFAAATAVGTDRYTLAYEHSPDGMRWTMVEGRLQTGQEGDYAVESLGPDRARVTYDLTIHHSLPLPGFVRSRIIAGLVDETLSGLQERMAAST
ncbi:polyketide cyclase [Intrasporangium oryzae NRRL B-24470]|uniref:Polyketide cyclase n=1 Tax=Intrasporangium oryzae NRRL B-24470 TaxID=1386089 RepID=W9G9H1_9MICO|nr:SRPBCC family protein [Intrasporangium oryzae]EWT02846.1 polyketide cyclase [Intrasporangium oryzae NRRL B-24470]